jgi:hypothetical protein
MIDAVLTRLLILVLTDAGGEGKTLLALLFRSLLELAGEPVGYIDADAGNYSGAIQLQQTDAAASVKTIRLGASVNAATGILRDHVGKHIVIDTGANTSASEREITKMIPALQEQAKAAGYRTVAFLPVSTNKPGASGALIDLSAGYPQWEHIFVQVNRDGSGSFEGGLDPTRTVSLGHLQPGLQQYVREARGLPAAAVQPPVNFHLAADKVAAWMTDFSNQELVTQLVGLQPARALVALGRGRPLTTSFIIQRLGDATNDALRYNAKRTAQLRILEKGRWDVDSHREVIRLIEAGVI